MINVIVAFPKIENAKSIKNILVRSGFHVDAAVTTGARKEVIKLLGGVISGMNVGQPVIMQAANSEAQELTEDVMDDAEIGRAHV